MSPGISVWIPTRRTWVAVCAQGYLCESQLEELGLLCAPRDICVNPKEKRSGCCVRPGISVWIPKKRDRDAVCAQGYLCESQKKEKKKKKKKRERSGCCVRPVISVWIQKKRDRDAVCAQEYLCESRKKRKKKERLGCCVRPGISVWIPKKKEKKKRDWVAVCAQGYLCESQRKEIGLLCAPRDICVNPKEKRSGCCVRPGISVWIPKKRKKRKEIGLLCAPRDICVNPKEKRSGCCVRPGISVWIPKKKEKKKKKKKKKKGERDWVAVCAQGYLCESQRKEIGLLCAPRDICVNPKGKRSGCCVRLGISVWIPKKRDRVAVCAQGYLCESQKKRKKKKRLGCCVRPGISVWIPKKRDRVAVCAQGYLCESQRKEIGLLCAPRDICVNPKGKRSGCCVRPGISVWIPKKRDWVAVCAQGYPSEPRREELGFLCAPRDICVNPKKKS